MESQTFTSNDVRKILGIGESTFHQLTFGEDAKLVGFSVPNTAKGRPHGLGRIIVTRASLYRHLGKEDEMAQAPLLTLPPILTMDEVSILLGVGRATANVIVGDRWYTVGVAKVLTYAQLTELLQDRPRAWSHLPMLPAMRKMAAKAGEVAELTERVQELTEMVEGLIQRENEHAQRPVCSEDRANFLEGQIRKLYVALGVSWTDGNTALDRRVLRKM